MKNSTKSLEFRFERTIPAAPDEVYRAWLDPNTPGTPWHEADKLILDPQVDGLFNWVMQGISHYGRFTMMERSSRIQHTWVSPNTLGEESLVTVTFKNQRSDTLMTLVHSGLPDDDKARSHEEGWNYFLDKLVDSLGSGTRRRR